jgi:ATP-dependent helicase/nuclease subunit A
MTDQFSEKAYVSPPPLTRDQKRASDPTSSVWMGANAGTGKTHVLSARVLRMMLTGTPPDKILCLTFTKAGANEMANRISHELGEWTSLSDDNLKDTIEKKCGEIADIEMLERARKLFAEVLDIPGGLKVRTIHSFFQSLLGRFPIEAEITPNFKLIDDRATLELTQKARDTVYAIARKDATSAESSDERGEHKTNLLLALNHIVSHTAESTFADLMTNLGREQGHLQKLVNEKKSLNGVIEATYCALGITRGLEEETLLREVAVSNTDEGGGMDDPVIKGAMGALINGTKTDQAKAAVIDKILAARSPEDRTTLGPNYMNNYLTSKGGIRASLATKGVLKTNPELEQILSNEAARIKGLFDKIELLKAAKNTEAILVLANSVLAEYSSQKQIKGQLDFNDIILKARDLLSSPNIAPWILFKLDGGLDHILVDEAQDTNLEQWQLIETLCNEFFVGESAREQTRTMFAVGDVKQSIYKFQKAEPKEFVNAGKRVSNKADEAKMPFSDVPLEKSFRSTDVVLKAVDAVFSQDEVRANLSLNEKPIHHEVHRKGEGGVVELWPQELYEKEPMPDEWEAPTTQHNAKSIPALVAGTISSKIEAMVKGKEELESKGRPIRAGDILILVQTRNNDFINPLIRQLKEKDIPVAGSDRLVVTDDLAVMDLMAIADFCLLPNDNLTLATVLKGPLFDLNEDQLFALAYARGKKSLWQALREKNKEQSVFEGAFNTLTALLKLVDFEGPHEFFSKILTYFKGRNKLMARLGLEISDPLDEFLSLALSYEQTHTPSLQGFLHWVRTGNVDIKRDNEAVRDEVRIMTIHGAKGLEAPIVFLPDCSRSPRVGSGLLHIEDKPSSQSDTQNTPLLLWPKGVKEETALIKSTKETGTDDDIAEYKRLMYVAMTRAEDRLYMTGWKKKTKNPPKHKTWYDYIEAGLETLDTIKRVEDEEGRCTIRLTSIQTKPLPVLSEGRPKQDFKGDLPPWALTPPAPEAQPSRPLAPSRMDDDEPPAKSPLTKGEKKGSLVLGASSPAYKRGTIIHKLLELLPELAPENQEDVAKKWLARPAMELALEEQIDILASTLGVLNHADFAALFGAGSRAEVSLTGVVGTTAISGEIDRLVVLDDKVLVIDYKTNRPPPKSPEDVPKKYLKQMAAYKGLLEQIYPNHSISMALLWTEDVRLMTLDDALLSPFAPK